MNAGQTDAGRAASGPAGGDELREVSARAVADRVLKCPDVARLSGGPFGAVATYLPGGLVPGVAVREDHIEVHVVAWYGRPLPDVAEAVRDAIGDLAVGRRVDVTIADVTSAGDTGEEE